MAKSEPPSGRATEHGGPTRIGQIAIHGTPRVSFTTTKKIGSR